MSSFSSFKFAQFTEKSTRCGSVLIFTAVLTVTAGCSPLWESPPTKNGAGVGAAAGAAVGAGLGVIVGATAGDATAGLAVGTAAGAAVGALVGNEAQKQANARGQTEELQEQDEQLDNQQLENEKLKQNLRDSAARPRASGYQTAKAQSNYSNGRTSGSYPTGNFSPGTVYSNPAIDRSKSAPGYPQPQSGYKALMNGSAGESYAINSSPAAKSGRVYLSPPSTYQPAKIAAVETARQSNLIANPNSSVLASTKPLLKNPAPSIRPELPAAGPELKALASTQSAKAGITESTKSILPGANTGSILPPPAKETAAGEIGTDGLPKLEVDDSTVKALEEDGDGEGEVLGSVAEPIEGPDHSRARLEDQAAQPQAQLGGGLPPPKGAAAAINEKLMPAAGEVGPAAKAEVKPLPELEKEAIKPAAAGAVISSESVPSKSATASATTECKQASAEVQRAKSAVSDADRLFYYRRAVRLCSGEPSYHVEIGKLYINLGRTEDAKFEFRQAIDLDPANQPARDNLSKLESEGGKL